MKRNVKYSLAIYASVVVLVLGLFALMIALGDKIARWGGYADSLPLLGLFVLFVVGQFILTPRRR